MGSTSFFDKPLFNTSTTSNEVNLRHVTPMRSGNLDDAFVSWCNSNGLKLTASTINAILNGGYEGNAQDQAAVFKVMQEHEPIIAAHLETRKLSVLGKDWDIVGGTKAKRETIKQILEDAGIYKLMRHLLDAIANGYSGAGINWRHGGGKISEFKLIDPSNWTFDRQGNVYLYTGTESLTDLQKESIQFVFHEHMLKPGIASCGGLLRVLIWTYFFKGFAVQNQNRYLEKYGMPSIIAEITDEDFSDASTRTRITNELRAMASDGVGVTTNQSKINMVTPSGQSSNADYLRWIQYNDTLYTLLILGQLASSSEAGGFSQGQVQENVRGDLLEADCNNLMNTINDQIVNPLCYFKYGQRDIGEDKIRFIIDCNPPEDVQALLKTASEVQTSFGFRPTKEWISEKTGIPFEEEEKEKEAPIDLGALTGQPTTEATGIEEPEAEGLPANPLELLGTNDTGIKKKDNLKSFADEYASQEYDDAKIAELYNAEVDKIIENSTLPRDIKDKFIASNPERLTQVDPTKYINDMVVNEQLSQDAGEDVLKELAIVSNRISNINKNWLIEQEKINKQIKQQSKLEAEEKKAPSISENELESLLLDKEQPKVNTLISETLEKNKNKNFIKRILNPEGYPVIKNEDGTVSSHLMSWSTVNGKPIVYPTIVQDEFGNLEKLDKDDALDYAITNNEYIPFETEDQADYFSRNYKQAWVEPDIKSEDVDKFKGTLLEKKTPFAKEFIKLMSQSDTDRDVKNNLKNHLDEMVGDLHGDKGINLDKYLKYLNKANVRLEKESFQTINDFIKKANTEAVIRDIAKLDSEIIRDVVDGKIDRDKYVNDFRELSHPRIIEAEGGLPVINLYMNNQIKMHEANKVPYYLAQKYSLFYNNDKETKAILDQVESMLPQQQEAFTHALSILMQDKEPDAKDRIAKYLESASRGISNIGKTFTYTNQPLVDYWYSYLTGTLDKFGAQEAYDNLQDLDQKRDKIDRETKQILDSTVGRIESSFDNPILKFMENTAYGTVESAPATLLTMALLANPTTTPLGVAFLIKQGYADATETLKDIGVDNTTAHALGAVVALPYAWLEKLKISKFGIKPQMLQNITKLGTKEFIKRLTQIATVKGIDYLEQNIQEAAQDAIIVVAKQMGQYLDDNVPAPNQSEDWTEFIQNRLQTALSLLYMQVATGGLGVALNKSKSKQTITEPSDFELKTIKDVPITFTEDSTVEDLVIKSATPQDIDKLAIETTQLDTKSIDNRVDTVVPLAMSSDEIRSALYQILLEYGDLDNAVTSGRLDIKFVSPEVVDSQRGKIINNGDGTAQILINKDNIKTKEDIIDILAHEDFVHRFLYDTDSPLSKNQLRDLENIVARVAKMDDVDWWSNEIENVYKDYYSIMQHNREIEISEGSNLPAISDERIAELIKEEMVAAFMGSGELKKITQKSRLGQFINDIRIWLKQTFPKIFGDLTFDETRDVVSKIYQQYRTGKKGKLLQKIKIADQLERSFDPESIAKREALLNEIGEELASEDKIRTYTGKYSIQPESIARYSPTMKDISNDPKITEASRDAMVSDLKRRIKTLAEKESLNEDEKFQLSRLKERLAELNRIVSAQKALGIVSEKIKISEASALKNQIKNFARGVKEGRKDIRDRVFNAKDIVRQIKSNKELQDRVNASTLNAFLNALSASGDEISEARLQEILDKLDDSASKNKWRKTRDSVFKNLKTMISNSGKYVPNLKILADAMLLDKKGTSLTQETEVSIPKEINGIDLRDFLRRYDTDANEIIYDEDEKIINQNIDENLLIFDDADVEILKGMDGKKIKDLSQEELIQLEKLTGFIESRNNEQQSIFIKNQQIKNKDCINLFLQKYKPYTDNKEKKSPIAKFGRIINAVTSAQTPLRALARKIDGVSDKEIDLKFDENGKPISGGMATALTEELTEAGNKKSQNDRELKNELKKKINDANLKFSTAEASNISDKFKISQLFNTVVGNVYNKIIDGKADAGQIESILKNAIQKVGSLAGLTETKSIETIETPIDQYISKRQYMIDDAKDVDLGIRDELNESILEVISLFQDNPNMTQGDQKQKVDSAITNKINDILERYQTDLNELKSEAGQLQKEISEEPNKEIKYKLQEALRKLNEKISKKESSIEILNENKNNINPEKSILFPSSEIKTEVKLSIAQIMNIYNLWKTKDGKVALTQSPWHYRKPNGLRKSTSVSHKFTESEIESIIDQLDDKYKKFADILFDMVNEPIGKLIKDRYRARNNFDLETVDGLFWPIFRDSGKQRIVNGKSGKRFRSFAENPHLQKRKKNVKRPLVIDEVFDVYLEMEQFASMYDAYDAIMGQLDRFFNNKKIVDVVDRKHGEPVMKAAHQIINNIYGEASDLGLEWGIVNWLKRNASKSMLALSPTSITKQPASYAMSLLSEDEPNVVDFIKGAALIAPRVLKREFTKYEKHGLDRLFDVRADIEARLKGIHMNKNLNDMSKIGDVFELITNKRPADELWFYPTQATDQATVHQIALDVLNKERKKLKLTQKDIINNKEPDDFYENVGKRVWDKLATGQPMNRAQDLPALANKAAYPILYIWQQFRGATGAITGAINEEFIRIANKYIDENGNIDKLNMSKATSESLAKLTPILAIMAMYTTGIGHGWGAIKRAAKDEDEWTTYEQKQADSTIKDFMIESATQAVSYGMLMETLAPIIKKLASGREIGVDDFTPVVGQMSERVLSATSNAIKLWLYSEYGTETEQENAERRLKQVLPQALGAVSGKPIKSMLDIFYVIKGLYDQSQEPSKEEKKKEQDEENLKTKGADMNNKTEDESRDLTDIMLFSDPQAIKYGENIFALQNQINELEKQRDIEKKKLAPYIKDEPLEIDNEGTIYYVDSGESKVMNRNMLKAVLQEVMKISPEQAERILNSGSTLKIIQPYIKIKKKKNITQTNTEQK